MNYLLLSHIFPPHSDHFEHEFGTKFLFTLWTEEKMKIVNLSMELRITTTLQSLKTQHRILSISNNNYFAHENTLAYSNVKGGEQARKMFGEMSCETAKSRMHVECVVDWIRLSRYKNGDRTPSCRTHNINVLKWTSTTIDYALLPSKWNLIDLASHWSILLRPRGMENVW